MRRPLPCRLVQTKGMPQGDKALGGDTLGKSVLAGAPAESALPATSSAHDPVGAALPAAGAAIAAAWPQGIGVLPATEHEPIRCDHRRSPPSAVGRAKGLLQLSACRMLALERCC